MLGLFCVFPASQPAGLTLHSTASQAESPPSADFTHTRSEGALVTLYPCPAFVSSLCWTLLLQAGMHPLPCTFSHTRYVHRTDTCRCTE